MSFVHTCFVYVSGIPPKTYLPSQWGKSAVPKGGASAWGVRKRRRACLAGNPRYSQHSCKCKYAPEGAGVARKYAYGVHDAYPTVRRRG